MGSLVNIFCKVIGLLVEVFIVVNWYFLFEVLKWVVVEIVVEGWFFKGEVVVVCFWLSDEFVVIDVVGVGCGVVGWCRNIFFDVIESICCCNSVMVLFWLCVIFLNFLGKKFNVLVFSVFNVVFVLLWVNEENIKMGMGLFVMIFWIVEILFMMGIFIFIVIIFGLSWVVFFMVFFLFIVILMIFKCDLELMILFMWWWKKFELLIINILIVMFIFIVV